MPIKRLPDHDYSTKGAYFLTICAHRRRPLFASPPIEAAVRECWDAIPSHFPVDLGAFVVMPNHVHGILFLGAGHARPPTGRRQLVQVGCRAEGEPGERRSSTARLATGLLRRVVRSERELEALREYIAANPARWNADPENPLRTEAWATAPWLP